MYSLTNVFWAKHKEGFKEISYEEVTIVIFDYTLKIGMLEKKRHPTIKMLQERSL